MTTSAVFSVSQLNRQIKLWLEHDIGMVFVEGELSNVSKPSSGHYYFTLKDQQAQIRCAYFRNRQLTIGAELMQNGQRVVAHGRLSLYEARGDYQLIVESMRDYGLGELYRQFELLKTKLQQEGLFDRPRQALPKFPRCIGVITSPSGAALQDILTTLQRRYPLATVRIYASEVQGQQAHLQLIAALAKANQEAHAEVLILARGGGSIEDLWAFNQETLVRVVAHSHIPVVTGVGHETDFTMVDFVADLRAATPTAAAEAVTPDAAYLLPQIQHYAARLLLAAQASLQQAKFKIEQLTQKIISPKQHLQAQWQTLDYLEQRLLSGGIRMAHSRAQQLQAIEAKLQNNNPLIMLSQTKQSLHILTTKMQTHLQQRVQTLWQVLSTHMASLHALSPLATLDRGYSITQLDGAVVLHSQQVALHDRITVRLAHGHLLCEVLAKEVT